MARRPLRGFVESDTARLSSIGGQEFVRAAVRFEGRDDLLTIEIRVERSRYEDESAIVAVNAYRSQHPEGALQLWSTTAEEAVRHLTIAAHLEPRRQAVVEAIAAGEGGRWVEVPAVEDDKGHGWVAEEGSDQ